MAHFAEIKQKTDPTGHTADTLWVVERVIVAGNDISTAAGPLGENDMHADGEAWCKNFFKGGEWKQTSYTRKFRKQYAMNQLLLAGSFTRSYQKVREFWKKKGW